MKSKKTLIMSLVGIVVLVGAVAVTFGILGALPAKAQTPAAGATHPMMEMRGAPGGVMVATSDYVYVLKGNTLYQLSATGLKLTAQYEFPRPPKPTAGAAEKGKEGGSWHRGSSSSPGSALPQ